MTFAGVPAPGPDRPILEDSLRLSSSQAGAYITCPRQYALERRLRLSDTFSPYAELGTLVHAALEAAEKEVIGSGQNPCRCRRRHEAPGERVGEGGLRHTSARSSMASSRP